MKELFKRFITLFENGFTGIPDFDFDFIESECKDGESFEDTSDRLMTEFNELINIAYDKFGSED